MFNVANKRQNTMEMRHISESKGDKGVLWPTAGTTVQLSRSHNTDKKNFRRGNGIEEGSTDLAGTLARGLSRWACTGGTRPCPRPRWAESQQIVRISALTTGPACPPSSKMIYSLLPPYATYYLLHTDIFAFFVPLSTIAVSYIHIFSFFLVPFDSQQTTSSVHIPPSASEGGFFTNAPAADKKDWVQRFYRICPYEKRRKRILLK